MGKQGAKAEAERVYRAVIRNSVRAFGSSDKKTLASYANLAICLKTQGGHVRLAEAMKIEATVFKTRRRLEGPDDPTTVLSMAAVGRTSFLRGKYQQAEKIQRRVLLLTDHTGNLESAEAMWAAYSLGLTLDRLDKAADAEQMIRRALRVAAHVCGAESSTCAAMVNTLADVLGDQGKVQEAAQARTKAITFGA
jgi:tetratricopeptide (TPR) repeat protein